MQGISTLFTATMDGMQREKVNYGINILVGIDLMSAIIIISLVILILPLKMAW